MAAMAHLIQTLLLTLVQAVAAQDKADLLADLEPEAMADLAD
jgi:hypothetical protein